MTPENKEHKKRVKAVIKKWLPSFVDRHPRTFMAPIVTGCSGAFYGTFLGFVAAIPDLLLTGGAGTVTTIVAAIGAGAGATGGAACTLPRYQKSRNTLEQIFEAPIEVATALEKMDKKLTKLFNHESKCQTLSEKLTVRKQVLEVYQDAAVLQNECKIIKNSDKTKGANKYAFEVEHVHEITHKVGSDVIPFCGPQEKVARLKPQKLKA